MWLVYGEDHVWNWLLGLSETRTMLKIKKIWKNMAKKFWQSEKKEFSTANPFLAMLYYNKAFKHWKQRWNKNWERRYNEKKYLIHWDSSDEEEDDPDQPEVYEEVIYEELSPEKEMEMKWMLII